MDIIYSNHALRRLKQRGITQIEIEHILNYPYYIKKMFKKRKSAVGEVNKRIIKVVYIEKKNYINIITVI